jgi:hypothetical protein
VKYTIAEALQEMQQLRGADAGRLRGLEIRDNLDQLGGLNGMPEPWGKHIAEQIEARRAGLILATTPVYVVVSDGLPVAWVTVHAAVVAPTMPMSTIQAKHQRQAVAVLADLDREALQALADQRDEREGRPVISEDDYAAMVGALRVAPSHSPTGAQWVRVGADLDEAARELTRAAGVASADQVMILAAVGYGHHGYRAHRLSLELICAMQAVIAAHPVSLSTVGNWIDHDYGLAGQVDPRTLPEQFAAAYVGRFASRGTYARHRLDEQGWSEILLAHGIEPYFDTRRYEGHLFAHEAFAIDLDGWHANRGIEMFRRPPPDVLL